MVHASTWSEMGASLRALWRSSGMPPAVDFRHKFILVSSHFIVVVSRASIDSLLPLLFSWPNASAAASSSTTTIGKRSFSIVWFSYSNFNLCWLRLKLHPCCYLVCQTVRK